MAAVSRHSLLRVTGLLPALGYRSLLVTENGWEVLACLGRRGNGILGLCLHLSWFDLVHFGETKAGGCGRPG